MGSGPDAKIEHVTRTGTGLTGERLQTCAAELSGGTLLKDEVLDRLAESANVAQFVSFEPGDVPHLRHARLCGLSSTDIQDGFENAVEALLKRSTEGTVNVRSFRPDQPKSHDFIYGLEALDDVVSAVRRLAANGLYTIVNETIDIHDGGVSGVVYGEVIEFSPDDTPRAVEKPGIATLPRVEGMTILEHVYGFRPTVPGDSSLRVEFSIHPLRRGFRHEHTIVWEEEHYATPAGRPLVTWPNRFSRFLGDKVFGLLIADAIGLRVPATTVLSRRVAPFRFGASTGTHEVWMRTAPVEQVPGRFTTTRGWIDPFSLLEDEDPGGAAIASVLAQDGVNAGYSGAAAVRADRSVLVEGVAGSGEGFMQGSVPPGSLPTNVESDVRKAVDRTAAILDRVRLEWVHDGEQVWIVQLHSSGIPAHGQTVFPGRPTMEHTFETQAGLEALRQLVDQLQGTGEGVVLVGEVGITSHFGDVLRRARIPSRLAPVPIST